LKTHLIHTLEAELTPSLGLNCIQDRLSRVQLQIVYDDDGNRVSETAGSVTTKYLVDELTPTGYAQVDEEIVNGSVSAQYTYGLMRISQNRSGAVSYFGYDGSGSVRQLLNGTGAVTASDASGNTAVQSGSTTEQKARTLPVLFAYNRQPQQTS
jgi:hypothetical protein